MDSKLVLNWDEKRGVAHYIRGKLMNAKENSNKNNVTKIINEFLVKYGDLFGPTIIPKCLKLISIHTDDLESLHVVYGQTHMAKIKSSNWFCRLFGLQFQKNLVVYNAKLAVHVTKDGIIYNAQSTCWRDIINLSPEIKISEKNIVEIFSRKINHFPQVKELKKLAKDYSTVKLPQLVVFPKEDGAKLAWLTWSHLYGEHVKELKEVGRTGWQFVNSLTDVTTGEIFNVGVTSSFVNPVNGTGLGVTPLGGPFVSRSLDVDQVSLAEFHLHNEHNSIVGGTTEIITFDGDNIQYPLFPLSMIFKMEIEEGVTVGTSDISISTDDDTNWGTSLPGVTRTESQQPEVDAHFFVNEIFDWYDKLAGGRLGWVADKILPSLRSVPTSVIDRRKIRTITHIKRGGTTDYRNAVFQYYEDGTAWMEFPDGGINLAGDKEFDYLAGSKWIVAHEYQHGITQFNYQDTGTLHIGLLGMLDGNNLSAFDEGMSDVFAGFITDQWVPGPDISPTDTVYRNLVFPRSLDNIEMGYFKDHYDDLNLFPANTNHYARGTILAHCAFLLAKGGVHQRTGRNPELIPSYDIGKETINGQLYPKAAHIWYKALHEGLQILNEATMFHDVRTACLDAARLLHTEDSKEYKNTDLAFYAIGVKSSFGYGPDLTFLKWGLSWKLSQNYIGQSSPNYKALDLFINNDGITSDWNAQVNIWIDEAAGTRTHVENNVYCRVRNVGDFEARNITITLEYSKLGTAPTGWIPIKNDAGTTQIISIPTLGAGLSNFNDSEQSTPPTTSETHVKWSIPPLNAGESVNHFCIRARVSTSNPGATEYDDVNTYNNDVQSNVSYELVP